MPNHKLRELFNEVDTRKTSEIGFDDFTMLYQKIIFDENVNTFIILGCMLQFTVFCFF